MGPDGGRDRGTTPAGSDFLHGTNLTEPIFTQMLLDETAQGHCSEPTTALLTSITGRSFPVSCVLAPIVRDN